MQHFTEKNPLEVPTPLTLGLHWTLGVSVSAWQSHLFSQVPSQATPTLTTTGNTIVNMHLKEADISNNNNNNKNF